MIRAFAVLIFLVFGLFGGSLGQTPESGRPPDLQIVKYNWSKERIVWGNNPFSVPVETLNETRDRVRDERRPKSALEERSIRATKEEQKPPSKPPRYVFNYRLLVHNTAAKTIKEIDWDYIFTDAVTGELLGQLEFTSVEKVGAGKRKELMVRVSSPPTRSISIYTLGKDEQAGVTGSVTVKRILYDDATVWVAN